MAVLDVIAVRDVHGTIITERNQFNQTDAYIRCSICGWRSPGYPGGDDDHLRTVMQTHADKSHQDVEATFRVLLRERPIDEYRARR